MVRAMMVSRALLACALAALPFVAPQQTCTAVLATDGVAVEGTVPRGGQECFIFQAAAGSTYTIRVRVGTLADSVLTLLDSQGQQLAENDDAPWELNGPATQMDTSNRLPQDGSEIVWTAPSAGTYAVVVRGYSVSNNGDFTISVDESGAAARPPPTPPAATPTPPPVGPAVDCVGEWSPCTAACEPAQNADFSDRHWIESVPASGGGEPCDNTFVPPCLAGDGDCVAPARPTPSPPPPKTPPPPAPAPEPEASSASPSGKGAQQTGGVGTAVPVAPEDVGSPDPMMVIAGCLICGVAVAIACWSCCRKRAKPAAPSAAPAPAPASDSAYVPPVMQPEPEPEPRWSASEMFGVQPEPEPETMDQPVFISFRVGEALAETRALQRAFAAAGVAAYVCEDQVRVGSDWATEIAQKMEACKVMVCMASQTYGAEGTDMVGTWDELSFAKREGKHLCVVRMCQEFSEARTKMMVGGVQSVLWVSEEESVFKIVEEVKQMLSGALPAPPKAQGPPEDASDGVHGFS